MFDKEEICDAYSINLHSNITEIIQIILGTQKLKNKFTKLNHRISNYQMSKFKLIQILHWNTKVSWTFSMHLL